MSYLKSQSAIEFVILLGAMIFFFVGISYAFYTNISEKTQKQKTLEFEETAKTVRIEIELASSSTNGYERIFTIPEKITNTDYNITLVENYIYIQSYDQKNSLALPVKNVTGQIQKGNNLIRKLNGEVFLNE